MKGLGLFNYSSISSTIKTMISRPESTVYKNNFDLPKYTEDSRTLREVAQECGIFIGTVPEGKNESVEGSTFSKVLPLEFNSATAGNAMKWGKLLKDKKIGSYDFTTADRITDYVVSNGCRMRGHVLIWGRTPNGGYPAELDEIIKNSSNPKEDVRKIMKDHITVTMDHFRDRVLNWDVVNEPMQVFGPNFAGYSLYKVLGTDYIKDAFRYAREADKDARLYINEQFFDYKDKRAKVFLNLLKEMVTEGVPIDGVGLQHHIMYNEQNIEDFSWFLQQVKELGLKVEITELDIRQPVFKKSDNPELSQAEAYYKVAKACINSGICEGITIWGIDDDNNWYDSTPPFNGKTRGQNKPLLFHGDLSKKPAYYGLKQAFIEAIN